MRTRPWSLILPLAFAVGCIPSIVAIVVDVRGVGSHALIYTEAAATWLAGGNPWSVGPPAALFAGPPPLLLLFAPFTLVPSELNRYLWVAGSLVMVVWIIRRIGLPRYWLGFPPFIQAIHLGHFEPLVLVALLAGGSLSGLIALVKPYAAFPVVAERRWRAMVVASITGLITLPILPWGLFIEQLPVISGRIVTQSNGDSTFPHPIWMLVALVSLGSLGFRRASWLATPVLWPYAQSMYKVISVPHLSPFMAGLWALPVPGATLTAIAAEALLIRASRRWCIPEWILAGIGPDSTADGPAMLKAD